MTPEKIKELQTTLMYQSTKAIGEFLESRGATILAFKNEQPVSIGSGTCIEIKGRYFIATAAHVISEWSINQLWLVYAVDPVPSDEQIPVMRKGMRGGKPGNAMDVGWLELDADAAARTGKQFVSLEQIQCGVAHIPTDLAIVRGSPGQLLDNQWKERRLLAVQPMLLHTATVNPNEWPNGYSQEHDIVLSYPESGSLTDGEQYQIPDAFGLSGGGIWATNVNDVSGVWSSKKARLIGIQHAWRKPTRIIRGTQIQHWLRMIIEDYPELSPTIAPCLP